MSDILKKLSDENEGQYIWRIGQAKDAGLINETWGQLAPRLNAELNIDETEWRGESAFRKKYRVMQQAYDDVFSKQQFANEHQTNIADTTKELYIAKKQFEDQRRECRKLWTSEARFEHLTNKLVESVNLMCEQQPLMFKDMYVGDSYKDAVLCLADFHY